VHKVFEHLSVIWNNAGFGKIAFDDVGRFYVGGNSGIVRFEFDDESSGQLFYDQQSIIDVEVLPDGNLLAVPGSDIVELDPTGAFVRNIRVTDPNGVAGGGLFFISSPDGVEYDPVANEIFVTMGGFTGQNHRLMKLDADTGVLLEITTFINPQDLFFGDDRLLLSGSRTFAPGLFDTNLALIRTAGDDQFDDHFFVTQLLPPQVIAVEIDIRPGIEQNPVNPSSRGVIPVAILGSDTFDVADVDNSTLAFGPGGASPLWGLLWTHWDVNDDGWNDGVSYYRTQETGIAIGHTKACLTGETLDGTPFEGCDAIKTLPSCGLGVELLFILPPLMWLRGRPRRKLA
jgi:hypothetical protein